MWLSGNFYSHQLGAWSVSPPAPILAVIRNQSYPFSVSHLETAPETFPFLVHSPVGLEMPGRDPSGAKQRSGEMNTDQSGHLVLVLPLF